MASWADERRNPFKSTYAALHYLQDLYNVFGSWELALASYNMGPNKTKYLIIKHNERDYWSLAEQQLMPSETRNYVPKFLAAVLIADRPKAYGYDVPEVVDTWAGQFFTIRENVSLQQVAQQSQCEVSTLKQVNPDLLKNHILARKMDGFKIVIPHQCQKPQILVADAMEERAPDRIDRHRMKFNTDESSRPRAKKSKSKSRSIKEEYADDDVSERRKNQQLVHVMKRGDNLKKIAQKYGVSLPKLLKTNRLKHANAKLPPGHKIKIPS